MFSFICKVAPYVCVGFIGATVGVGELIARYKDDPSAAIRSFPAAFYVSVNFMASLLGYYFLNSYAILPSETGVLTKILLAGFGAMAIFRASLFTARVGSVDVPIGPSAFLQVILSVIDRAIDRKRAEHRAQAVPKIMNGISFEKASASLPIFCFALMQNVDDEEQKRAAAQVNDLAKMANMDDQMKSHSLGLILVNIVGEEVLRRAVDQTRAQIGST